MIFAYDYHAQLAYIMTFDHPNAHNFHSGHPQCRTNVVGLIYMTRSAMIKVRTHASRTQYS